MLKTKLGGKTGERERKFATIAKFATVAKIPLFCFSDLHSCFKIFTQTAKINTRKINKNCRKVKNKLEQRLT